MLEVVDIEYMRKCVAFARAKDRLPALLEQLWRLHTFGERGPDRPPECRDLILYDVPRWIGHGLTTVCRLTYDSAPASFGFSISKNGQHWFSGGLIYHGDQSGWTMRDGRVIPPGYGVETFSVSFGVDHAATPWSMHT